jgi:hypothetical protein
MKAVMIYLNLGTWGRSEPVVQPVIKSGFGAGFFHSFKNLMERGATVIKFGYYGLAMDILQPSRAVRKIF